MMAQAKRRKASSMSSRISHRMRSGLVTLSVASKRRVADIDLLLHVGALGQQLKAGVVEQLNRAYLWAVGGGADTQPAGPVGS
jgi:hypothetical protein